MTLDPSPTTTTLDPDTTTTGETTGSETTTAESTTEPTTGSESTSGGGSTESGSTSTGSTTSTTEAETSTASEASTTTVETSTTGNGAAQNGEPCESDDGCASGRCFILGPLGGLCSECLDDTDCVDGGCTIPDFLAQPPVGAVCNDGSLGGGCQSDAACGGGLLCSEIITLPGIVTNSTCGECVIDDDCAGDEVCAPHYDIDTFGGEWVCVLAGSDPNGQSCDLDAGGTSCASGFCAGADLLGVVVLGVCSECGMDDDCPPAELCAPPQAEFGAGLSPGVCE